MSQTREPVELKIPVPWGHVAGKAWGKSKDYPVLAIHGSMDNAATFDRLIPLLPQNFYYVSIDLPGSGQSSHLPLGFPYYFTDLTLTVYRIVNYFKWNNLIFIGHSFGGFVGCFFAAMYPNIVEKIVLLDIIGPKRFDEPFTVNLLRYIQNTQFAVEKLDPSKTPQYTYDDALNRLKKMRATKLSDEAAKCLISRLLVKTNNDKFSFSFDQRLKTLIHPLMPKNSLYEVYSNIKCPVLIIMSKDTNQLPKLEHLQKIMSILRNNCKPYQLTFVPGNHDVHVNNPEVLTKCWGKSDGQPLLGVHGLQDNAATFDLLGPRLPDNIYFVSIDLPGHGLSSHIPSGLLYHFFDLVSVILRVVNFMGWKKFHYMGHSFGGQIGMYFAAFYPERITKLILLDSIRPRPISEKRFLPLFTSMNAKLLELEKKLAEGQVPCYSYEETKQRLKNSRFSELNPNSSDILLARSLYENNGGYSFQLDQRLKFVLWPPQTPKQQMAILSNIKCEILYIKAQESLPMYSFKGVPQILEMLKRNCPVYVDKIVEGNHDVHLNNPERVDKIISKFLLYKKSKL